MSDKLEITARADGEKIVLRLPYDNLGILQIPMSHQECFALQCQLSAAYQAVKDKPKTWHDREPML